MKSPDRLHHVGISVQSLERSLAWYTGVLGLEGPIREGGGSGKEISDALQVAGVEVKVVCLKLPDGTLLELLEYEQPRGRPFTSANNDVGMVHVCFRVDDLDAVYEELLAKGVVFNAPPIRLDESSGELAGYAFVLFRDPDGVLLEFYEVPAGAEY
jgi:catechol 2,3-dioxygenase-like lactoylglutathione lyase family enzyme